MRWAEWRYAIALATLLLIGVVARGSGVFADGLAMLLAGPCLIAWLLVADRPRYGLVVFSGLLALLAVLAAWSQLWPGALPPPAVEWALVFGLVGAVAVAVVIHRHVRDPDPGLRQRLQAAVTLLVAVPVMGCGVVGFKALVDEPYGSELPGALFQAWGTVDDLLPLPADVDLVGEDCFNLGAHGICHNVFIVSATDGASRDALISRLASHYRARGWPLERSDLSDGSYLWEGCRPMRGIFVWADHCLLLYSDPEEEIWGHPEIPGTVNVYLGR